MNQCQTLLATCFALFAISGCSEKHDAASIGKSVGKNVTEFAQGVGTGVDAQLQIKIELSDALIASGLAATVAKQRTPLSDSEKNISVYFTSNKEFNASLVAKAFNSDGAEIGRATAEASFQSDDARYIHFSFPTEMDRQQVAVYKIESRTAPLDADKTAGDAK